MAAECWRARLAHGCQIFLKSWRQTLAISSPKVAQFLFLICSPVVVENILGRLAVCLELGWNGSDSVAVWELWVYFILGIIISLY